MDKVRMDYGPQQFQDSIQRVLHHAGENPGQEIDYDHASPEILRQGRASGQRLPHGDVLQDHGGNSDAKYSRPINTGSQPQQQPKSDNEPQHKGDGQYFKRLAEDAGKAAFDAGGPLQTNIRYRERGGGDNDRRNKHNSNYREKHFHGPQYPNTIQDCA